MRLVNLTPHPITITVVDGVPLTIPPEDEPARFELLPTGEVVDLGNGIEASDTRKGAIVNLPPPQEGVAYIVSRPLAMLVVARDDVFCVGESIRDEDGRVIGCLGLYRVDIGRRPAKGDPWHEGAQQWVRPGQEDTPNPTRA